MYHEEELKRLHAALSADSSYQQVGYSYDDKGGGSGRAEDAQVSSGEALDEEGVPFVTPPQLDVPPDMEVPTSWRLHAIITRTATFVSQQGMQMEILLKAKQADNPNFVFLQFGSPLHPYYRHVLGAIRAGRYQPEAENNEDKEEKGDDGEDEDGDDHYLHPSLVASSVSTTKKIELAPSIPSVPYKPSADCLYTQLVSRIRDRQAAYGGTNTATPIEEKIEMVLEAPISPEPPPPGEEAEAPLTPPADMQLIIDKMASYVAKNGREFEIIVRARGDPRFEFLDEGHPFHAYYEHKLSVYCEDDTEKKQKSGTPHKKSKAAVAAGPVSFSIRPKEPDCPLGQRSALPVEDSTDEEDENNPGSQTQSASATATTVAQSVIPVAPVICTVTSVTTTSVVSCVTQPVISETRTTSVSEVMSTSVVDTVVPVVAVVEPPVVADPHTLQQERRRKAALFLSRLQAPVIRPAPISNGSNITQVNNEDVDDVESLPSPTTPPPSSPPLTPPSPPRICTSPLREDNKKRSRTITPPPPPIYRKSHDRHNQRERLDRERDRDRDRRHFSKLGHHTRPRMEPKHSRSSRSRSKSRHQSSRSRKDERRKHRRHDRSSSVSSASSGEERRTSRR